MGHRANRARRKLKERIQAGDFDRDALRRIEIALMFAESDPIVSGQYEQALGQAAIRSRDHSRAYRERLRETPAAYRAYLDRQNNLRRKRVRSPESIANERERKRVWERANAERLREQRKAQREADPERTRRAYQAKYARDRAHPNYAARNNAAQKAYYARVKASDPVKYEHVLARARVRGARRRDEKRSTQPRRAA